MTLRHANSDGAFPRYSAREDRLSDRVVNGLATETARFEA